MFVYKNILLSIFSENTLKIQCTIKRIENNLNNADYALQLFRKVMVHKVLIPKIVKEIYVFNIDLVSRTCLRVNIFFRHLLLYCLYRFLLDC